MTDAEIRSEPEEVFSRRNLFKWGLGFAAVASVMGADDALAVMRVPTRKVAMLNMHTGESLSVEYWTKGRYGKDAMRQVAHFLRDHRNGKIHAIDPRLMDVVYQLNRIVGGKVPVQVVSGYRSPETNAYLREISDGVAQNSYHMRGQAIDLRLPGRSLKGLQKAALSLHAGGVGYYPASDFVHVDTGPVRHW